MGRREDVLQRLLAQDLVLPTPVPPRYLYQPVVRVADMAFVSGQIPLIDGELETIGRCGPEIDAAAGAMLAKIAMLHVLAEIDREMGLDAVKQIARLTVYVASAEGFTEQPLVANGASRLLLDIFGDSGKHARSAVGVAWLPLNAPVEVELTVATETSR